MARLVCVVFIVSCFFCIDARRQKKHGSNDHKDTLSWARACEPGKFYPGPQCSKCFCNQSKKRICGPSEICKLSHGPPNIGEIQRVLAVAAALEDLEDLPEVAHVSSECEPGLLYRMDCNRCLCLHRKSLTCEMKLCPSFEDVNRIKASQLTGKPCQRDTAQGCVECSCKDGKNSCRAKQNCGPSSSSKGIKKRRCVPGRKYKMKDGSGIKCTCSMDRKLSCGMNNNNTHYAPFLMNVEDGITGNKKSKTLDDHTGTENEHVISDGPAMPGIVMLNSKFQHKKPSHLDEGESLSNDNSLESAPHIHAQEDSEIAEDVSISKENDHESAPHIQPVNIALLRPKPHYAKEDSETAEDESISDDDSFESTPHIQPVDIALLRPKPHYAKKHSGDGLKTDQD